MDNLGIDPWSLAAIEQNRRWLSAYLLAGCGDRWSAEDLVQQVFHIAYEKRSTFAPGTNFRAWLRSIAQNCLKRHFERVQRRPLLVGDGFLHLDKAAEDAEEGLADPDRNGERVQALQACLRALTDRVREILQLRFQRGLSTREVSASFGMTVTAVDVAVFRARNALAACVKRKLTYG